MEKKDLEASRAKSRQALLNMARGYEKDPAKVNHAVAAYKEVIAIDPDSKEADEARDSILRIAQRLEREGKKYAAHHLYQQIARELPSRLEKYPLKY
ncbi:MAG: hypothetical protein ABIJ84_01610 [bacterium]